MCGIAGIFSLNRQSVSSDRLIRMTDALAHRGPDGKGHWVNDAKCIGFGHRRLAVIDLSENAKQPMHYRERYTITYNGELYNYLELREQLIKSGHHFHSNSDTEVILAAYAEYQEQCLSHFEGMFAFAIWDSKKEELFCARDRFGEKPFYFFQDRKNQFLFASEIKGLFAAGIHRNVNKRMLFYYLNYDVVEISHDKKTTFYEDIFSLEAGHYLKIDRNGKMDYQRYWVLSTQLAANDISFDEACHHFHELFYDSVTKRLRSDVPVGSSLSGGLDSSAVVLAIHQLNQGNGVQKTFSARFNDPKIDEGKYIDLITANKPIEAHTIFPSVETMQKELSNVFYHQEQPFGSSSIFVQWEVMKLARENKVTVLLDGQGSDEILAGYNRYFFNYFKELYRTNKSQMEREVKAFEALHNTSMVNKTSYFLEANFPKLLSFAGNWKRRLFNSNYQRLNEDFFNAYKKEASPFHYFSTLNEALYHSTVSYGLEKLLRFSDRNSMAFSREVRMPFLCHQLVEFVFSLPSDFKLKNGWTKYILRESMKKEFPSDIKNRVVKIGFEAPQEEWLQHPKMIRQLQDAKDLLTKEDILTPQSSITDWQAIMTYQLYQLARK